MIPVEKYRRLVDRLAMLTEGSDIDWELVGDQSTIQTRLGSYKLQLSKSYSADITVDILNRDGDTVDSFKDVDIDDDFDPSEHPYFSKLNRILETAKRRLSGADAALDEVLEELDSIIPF